MSVRYETGKEMSAILVFVMSSYGLAILLSLVIAFTGGHESPLIGLAYLSMFLPAASVLLVSATRHEPPRVHWTSFPMRYFPIALFFIPGVLHAVMLPVMAQLVNSPSHIVTFEYAGASSLCGTISGVVFAHHRAA